MDHASGLTVQEPLFRHEDKVDLRQYGPNAAQVNDIKQMEIEAIQGINDVRHPRCACIVLNEGRLQQNRVGPLKRSTGTAKDVQLGTLNVKLEERQIGRAHV